MANNNDKKDKLSPRKAKNFWGTLRRLLTYMSNRVWGVVLVLVLSITATIFSTLTPKILGEATTEIFRGYQEGMALRAAGETVERLPIDFDLITQILITVFVLYLSAGIFHYFQQFTMARIGQRTVYDLRKDLKAKMSRMPISYYDTHSNGDIMSRAVNDMDQIANTLQQSLTQFVQSMVQFVAVMVMMLSISVQLTVVALIIVVLSGVFVSVIAPRAQKMFAKQQKELGILNDQVEEIYSGHAVVKIYNHEETEIEKFEKQNESYYEASWKAQFLTGLMMPLISFARNIGYLAVAVLGGINVANGAMTLGNVQAFLQYVNQFSQPMRDIANLSNTIQATVASAERVFEVLDEPEMNLEHSNVESTQDSPYKIQFEHVQFGYGGPNEPLLMNDFNLDVKEGEMIAVVGPTGAGKSTLINLLERFYDIKGGSIKLNGVDTRDITREELRSHFAMVLQDTWLFNGTILENLRYGSEEHAGSEEKIYEAAKAAHVDDFVRKLPHGYDTILNEEASNLSQGQRQLITIARAFFADPEILILDEATSSVDTRTEVLIQRAMAKLLKGRTSFVIAHRLSTIRDADKIIVMDQGDVIETGNHDELMEKNGFYADLYNAQFANSETA
ncbi:ABC transporter ATP-binding protein [Desemzia sp. RIT804]|uniref:ABC transporter ATP-binding protein n=1 Tax=Desemzia sp. RIT 804 TaxID=2810209 RepID=UPI00194EC012|nr:ABC transporter ATP-binding protein [Desemzia sp. RIT 804]MBM6614433.1 ABC transporter ATP-binding protein [Desemzia sp. RIT 804]